MSYTEERVVKMTFDHAQFSKDIDGTIKSLKELDNALLFKNANVNYKAIDNLNSSIGETDSQLNKVEDSVGKVKLAFSAMQAIGFTAFQELTKTAMNFGQSLYANTLGQIISGGRQRAQNIETAKFQLEGMGKEWAEISGDINYAVEGTAYGLDQAARVASQLTASNVKVGNDMKNALRAISGVAAMTNRGYDEVGHIFTTVASNGRLMTMQMRQLSAFGLNVSANMLKYFKDIKNMSNITEQQLNDMVTKGKVSFKEFAEAMDYAFGEHAKEANKTFSGALSNMRAALSRIGEMFATPRMNFLRDLYNDMIKIINFSKSFIAMFTNMYELTLNKIGIWIHNLVMSEDALYALGSAISAVYTWVKALYTAAIEAGIALPNLSNVLKNIRTVTAALILEGEKYEKVKAVFRGIFNIVTSIGVIIKSIYYAFKPLTDALLKSLGITTTGAESLADALNTVAYVIRAIAIISAWIINEGLTKVLEELPRIIKGITLVLGGLLMVLDTLWQKFKIGFAYVTAFFAMLSEKGITAKSVISFIGEKFLAFGGIVTAVVAGAKDTFGGFFDFVSQGFSGLFANLFKTSSTVKNESDKVATKTAGMTGGKYLSGHAGGMISVTKAFKSYQEAEEQAKNVDTSNPKTGTALDGVMGQLSKFSGIIPGLEKDSKAVTKATDLLSGLGKTIAEHFKDPKNLFKDAGILLGIGALTVIFTSITKLIAKAAETGKVANKEASADIITAVSKVLWSIAGVIVAMGLVSKYIDDIGDFKSIGKILTGIVFVFGVMIHAISTLSKVKTMAKSMDKLAKGIRASLNVSGEIKLTIRQTISAMSDILHEIGRLVLIIGGSIAAFVIMAKVFDVDADEFVAYALILSGTVLGIVGGLAILNAAFKKINQQSQEGGFSLSFNKDKFFQTSSKSVQSTMNGLIRGIVPLIAAVTIAIAVLGKYDFKSIATAGAALIIGCTVLLLEIMMVMKWFDKTMNKNTWFFDQSGEKFISRLKAFDLEFIKISFVIKSVMTSLAMSIRILEGMKWKQIAAAGITLAVGTAAIMGMMILWFKTVMHATKEFPTKDGTKQMKRIAKAMESMAIGMSMITIATSIAIAMIGKIDSDNLVPAAVTFGIVMAAMTGLMMAIMYGMSKLVDSCVIIDTLMKNTSTIKSVLLGVGLLFGEIVVAALIISVAFVAIAKALDDMQPRAGTLIAAGAILAGALAALLGVMFVITKLSKSMPNISTVVSMVVVMTGISMFLLSIAGVVKILSTIDWSAFEGSEKYLIGFGLAIIGIIAIVALCAKMLNGAVAGVVGMTVILMAIGTMAVLLGASAYIFALAIEKTKDAFIEIANVPWEKATAGMNNLKSLIATFVDAMSFSFKVMAAALVFSAAMFLMGTGLKLLASLDPKAMEGVVESLRIIFTDMNGLAKLALVGVLVAALFGVIGTSLAIGAVGFVVFAALLPVIVDLIIPAITKLVTSLGEMKPIFENLGDTFTSDEIGKMLKGLGQLFLIGAVLGISASTLGVSAFVFLAGAWVLNKAAGVFQEAMANMFKALEDSFGGIKAMIGDCLMLFLLGAAMGIAAVTIGTSAVTLLIASAAGFAASKLLTKFLVEMDNAFSKIDVMAFLEGCVALVAAATAIGIASVVLSLAGVPFIIAMTLFGIGIFMLVGNVALLSLAVAGLAWGFNQLAEISGEKLQNAVANIVYFLQELHKALSEAVELLNDGTMTSFAEVLLGFSLSMAAVSIILPLAGVGLMIGGGLLILSAKIFKTAFEQMTEAFSIFNSGTTMDFLASLSIVTDELGSFAGWFMLYNIPFAIGAAGFCAAAWLLAKGFQIITFVTKTYDVKKLAKKLEPITDIGKTFLAFSAIMVASSALILGAAFMFSIAADMIMSVIEQAIPLMEQFGEAVNNFAEDVEEASEHAKKTADNTINGLKNALTLGHPEIIDEGASIASKFLSAFDEKMGIHSPATEMIWRGLMMLLGLEEGMDEGEDGVLKETDSITGDIKDKFGGIADWLCDTLGIAGWDGGSYLGANLSSALDPWLDKATGKLGGLASMAASVFNIKTADQWRVEQHGFEQSAAYATNDAKRQEYLRQAAHAKEMAAQMETPEGVMKTISEKVAEFFGKDDTTTGGGGYTPTYTGGEGLPEDYKNAGKSAGSSSGASDARAASSNVGSSITNNNNYNFIQNNYSPEPIDRTELYNQTNAQLNTWYKFIGSRS